MPRGGKPIQIVQHTHMRNLVGALQALQGRGVARTARMLRQAKRLITCEAGLQAALAAAASWLLLVLHRQ